MNIYLISQEVNRYYDTYDAAIVAAKDKKSARQLNPATGKPMTEEDWSMGLWCSGVGQVTVKYLGKAKQGTKQSLLLSSFNGS